MIEVRVDHYFHRAEDEAAQIVTTINQLKGTVMASQTQLAADIAAVAANVTKIGIETRALLDRIAALQAALDAAGEVSPEVTAAMADLNAQVVAVDALVPDA